jgi:hypothetical protein
LDEKGIPMKAVYLDQKDWIFLAKAYFDPSLKRKREICSRILEASEEGVVSPLSIIHFQETLQRLKKGRKEKLASFMIKASKGYSRSPCNVITEIEIPEAFFKKQGLPVADLQEIAIRHGVSGMLFC